MIQDYGDAGIVYENKFKKPQQAIFNAVPVFSPGLVYVSVSASSDFHPFIVKQVFDLLSPPGEILFKVYIHRVT